MARRNRRMLGEIWLRAYTIWEELEGVQGGGDG